MPWTNPETFTAGQTLTAASMNIVSDNASALYASQRLLGYTRQTATGSVATTAAAPVNRLFSTGVTFTADGVSAYMVEVDIPYVITATNAGAYVVLYLCDSTGTVYATSGGNALGFSSQGNGTQAGLGSFFARFRWTPTAGSKTVNIGATHAVAAGAIGSTAATMLASLAIYGPDIT
jgi:hypothetical protein